MSSNAACPHQKKTTIWPDSESSLLQHIFPFLVRWRPLVVVGIITAAKEKVKEKHLQDLRHIDNMTYVT